MRSSLVPSLLCLATLVAGNAADAGVKITMEDSSIVVLLEPDRLAVVSPGFRSIFRDDLQTAWIVDERRRYYFEVNAEVLQQADASIQAAMEGVRAVLKSLPRDQRKQAEAMMAAQGMSHSGLITEAPPIAYRRLGQTRRIGNWSCEMFEDEFYDRKLEFCAAPLTEVGLTRADLKAYQNSFLFDQKAMPYIARRSSKIDLDALSEAAGYDAIPLETTLYRNGRQILHSVVRSIERSDIPPATFELPAGFTKEELPKPPFIRP